MILDNGRTNLLRGRYKEMLACIRCGACLNVCPVYRKSGGAAYGPVYSGPMGAVLLPLLVGLGPGAGAAARLFAVRGVHRCVPGEDPAARAAARPASRPRRGRGRVPLRAARILALVVGVVVRAPGTACPPGWRGSGSRSRAGRARSRMGCRADAAAARSALPGSPMSLVDEFAANAAAVGFHVHRGEAPAIEGAGVSTALYGLADTGSVVLAAVAGRAACPLAASGRRT